MGFLSGICYLGNRDKGFGGKVDFKCMHACSMRPAVLIGYNIVDRYGPRHRWQIPPTKGQRSPGSTAASTSSPARTPRT
jgi:hypothetical protein